MVIIPEDEYNEQHGIIRHYGTPRHSGRYPWGSGKDESTSQRNKTLLDTANELKAKGLSEVDIARGLNMTTTELRSLRTIVRNEQRQDQIHMAEKLKEKGMSNVAIARRMQEAGYNVKGESQVRALLQPSQKRRTDVLNNVTNTLRSAVDKKEFLDVGSGVEFQLGITTTKLRSALKQLKDEGYSVWEVKIDQLTTGHQTTMRVLTKPGTSWSDAQRNRHNIQQLEEYSNDGGLTSLNMLPPVSIDPKRVKVLYEHEGGTDADGVIYVRRGVPDVSLGNSRYAQVRIAVGGTHYLKGMAVYKDDLPDGVDLVFNTNKKDTGNKLAAMKPLKRLRADGDDPSDPDKFTGPVDQDNPFGASIKRQIGEGYNPRTNRPHKLTSVMNIVNDEGDWDKWSKSLSSQLLSKQPTRLAREQLDLAFRKRESEFQAILRLNNPAVRKKLLIAFADGADSAAVHLKAAHLPRQRTQVILPVKDMKPNEVYAPNFKPGERVVLVRFPHGGTFEIPELVVNNKNPAARKLLGDARDAIGIHPKVAERLSGADFDGDSVLVIPNNLGKIRTSPALEGLKNFDPKSSYPPYEGMKRMTPHEKGMQMGLVSNLITDMTIGGANAAEIAQAVRHSMVVIDAEKHNLDFRRSARENGISALMARYQKGPQGGASTLISRASSPTKIPERKERSAAKGGPIDPKTGKKVYEPTGRTKTWKDENGKIHVVERKMEVDKLALADDAHTLSSGTVIEKAYGDYSNKTKALANQARRELVKIKSQKYDPSARVAHRSDVETLDAKLNLALRNAPRERQAQVLAGAVVRLKMQANPHLKDRENKAELKRVKAQALAAARVRTGADKVKFEITDNEWLAIQNGAITAHKLDQILTYADLDRVKELATPRTKAVVSTANVSRAKSMHARGYTWAEIAEALGVSATTAQNIVLGEGD